MDERWDGPVGLDENATGQLTAAGVRVDERRIAEFVAVSGELAAVRFTDNTNIDRRGVLVAASLHQRRGLAAQLGVIASPFGPVPPWPNQKENADVHARVRSGCEAVLGSALR